MSTTSTDNLRSETVTLSLPSDIALESQRAASALDLKAESYLMILHDINAGKVARSFLREAREVFTKDREVLEELAK